VAPEAPVVRRVAGECFALFCASDERQKLTKSMINSWK
jgi:hypothetical protein